MIFIVTSLFFVLLFIKAHKKSGKANLPASAPQLGLEPRTP